MAKKAHRKAKIDFRARRSLRQLHLQLRSKPLADWPPALSDARRILTGELALEPAKALAVILKSVSVAHDSIRAQNKQLNDLFEAQARTKIRKACSRISKSIKRAPAVVRRRLDQAILPLIEQSVIDLEVVEAIFAAAFSVFDEFPDSEPSSGALRALRELSATPFSALGMKLRHDVQMAIAKLGANSNPEQLAKAIDVFTTMTTALGHAKVEKLSKQSNKSIKRYVSEIAVIWRHAGLKPSRAVGFLNAEYRTKFHRFAELVLGAMVAPRADRTSGGELVTDDDLKTALRAD